jgi:hypothetical protein
MDRDDLLRRQQELLRQEAVIRTAMAALGMKQPPRWNEKEEETPLPRPWWKFW